MKIIHTSDWHIGSRLYDYDRSADHSYTASMISRICREQKPDALIVAGDLFHTDHPSAADQRLVSEMFARLRTDLPGMAVIAIAGNHDSPSRHESHEAVFAAAGVTMRGRLTDRIDDWPRRYIIDVGTGVVVTIPFYVSRGTDLGALMAEARCVAGERPVVVAAHTTISGSDTTGHDGRVVGMIDAVSASEFLPPESYDYLALGHLHRPQRVGCDGRIRYSGSPLAVSFDETYPHSVAVVEIERRGAVPEVEEIVIIPERPLITLPSPNVWITWEDALEALREFPADKDAFIRLNVLTVDPLPSTAWDDARRAAEGKLCRMCNINVRRFDNGDTDKETTGMSVEELRMASPLEVASRYAASIGMELDGELFEEILEELTAGDTDDETA